jgi:hypothetical protein
MPVEDAALWLDELPAGRDARPPAAPAEPKKGQGEQTR